MKTRGITLAFAKTIFLQLIFLLPGLPALAQLSFALQKDQPVYSSSKGTQSYLPAMRSGVQALPTLTTFLSSTVKNNDAGNSAATIDKNKTAAYAVGGSVIYTDNAAIRFIPTRFTYPQCPGKDIGISSYPVEQLMLYAEALKHYARRNGYDTTYGFFSNMGMLSGKKRFFVVNLVTMELELSGLVAQGRGTGPTRFDKQYSNEKESLCTSLGRYKIMNRYKGVYGEAYRLAGLDSTNDNAYERNIVLHAMGCMTDEEDMKHVCISEGCPAVSPNFLLALGKIIDSRDKPLLLWVFDSNLEEAIKEIPEHDTDLGEPEPGAHHCTMHHKLSHRE